MKKTSPTTVEATSPSPHLSSVISIMHKQLIAVEIVVVFLGSLLFSALRFDRDLVVAITQYPGFPKILIYPLLWYFFLYRTHSWDRSVIHLSNEFYVRIFKAGWQSLIAFASFAYLLKYPISRLWVATNAIGITVFLLCVRFLFRWFYLNRRDSFDQLTYIYIGKADEQNNTLADFSSTYGFLPRIFQLDPPKNNSTKTWLSAYEASINHTRAYGVIIGVGAIQDAGLLRQLADFKRDSVIDFLLTTRIGAISPRFEQLESPALVRIRESSIVSGGAVLKRMFDIVFSFVVLVLSLPILALIAIFIKATSPGPILYNDKRVGKDGQLFTFPKFRSMYVGADKERLNILGRPDEAMAERYKKDPRITPFGRFLRRWSLDEFPQFWCVLIGTMSVVGPRPILREELEQIHESYQIRFLAKPGLTGLWQVTGRKEVAWNDRMVRDIAYIDNWSFSNDLFLIWKTLGAVLKGQGAH